LARKSGLSAVEGAVTPQEARTELLTKTLSQIHEATALTWAARAVAAKALYRETQDVRWATTLADAAHEALEHAALSDDPRFIDLIRAQLGVGGAVAS
jgi:hypothetical protein